MEGMSSSAAQNSSDLDYSEELQLNIPCFNDDNNLAVLYCADCKTNLCRECSTNIHSWKCFSTHKIVRLTRKLESQISCHLHPETEAKLICKEPNCVGINKPICVWCHQYDKHKNHKYELLKIEKEHTEETPIITRNTTVPPSITKASLLKEIEAKRKLCDEICYENYRCITSYFESESVFMDNERLKIDKFYSNAKTLALKTFEEFARNRVKTLLPLQQQCERDKELLDNTKDLIRNLRIPESTEEGNIHNECLRALSRDIAKTAKNSGQMVPFERCSIKYPSIESININIDFKPRIDDIPNISFIPSIDDIPSIDYIPNIDFIPSNHTVHTDTIPIIPQLPLCQRKPIAFYHVINPSSHGRDSAETRRSARTCRNTGIGAMPSWISETPSLQGRFALRDIWNIEKQTNGTFYTFKNGQSMLFLTEKPNENNADTSKYDYVAVVEITSSDEEEGGSLLIKEIQKKWVSRIIVLIDTECSKYQREFVKNIKRLAENDKRIEFVECFEITPIDVLLLSKRSLT